VNNRSISTAGSRPEYPLSTNVSSPIQAASRRRVAEHKRPHARADLHPNDYSHDDFVPSDSGRLDSEYDSEDFENVREAGKPERSIRRKLGPPITTDEKLEGVDPAHRFVIDDFLVRAKKESDNVSTLAGNKCENVSY
jgi:bloom syndrome protein